MKICRFMLLVSLLLSASAAWGQKTVYIPYEWTHPWPSDSLLYAESDPDNKYTWSKSRSVESDNVIIFWDKYYGNTSPQNTSGFYNVDINDLLAKCESFYELEMNTLGFHSSNMEKYKVMVLMNHTETWTCYGGGYDFQVSALWLNPSTCKPVGSAVAHEVGHSYHYMCYADDSKQNTDQSIHTGFHDAIGNGAAIWETTANWQALQSYPNEFFTMSGTNTIFAKSHNYAFTHEWHRYQAYPFLQFLCDYYNDVTTVSKIWKQRETTVKDFNEVLMDNKNLSVKELYKLHFLFAMHAVTWDMDFVKKNNLNRTPYIGNFVYNYVKIANKKYQVAYASAPQSTGFNVIPLKVPTAGDSVKVRFTALAPGSKLAEGDPAQYLNGESVYANSGKTSYASMGVLNKRKRGFRLGYVALMTDNTTQYFHEDSVYCTGTGEVSADFGIKTPQNVKQMWLVVSPTPTSYFQHPWDENFSNDDQWPYTVAFTGTDIKGEKDVTLSKTYMNISDESAKSLDELKASNTYFAMQSKANSQYAYFTGAHQDISYGTLLNAQASTDNGYLFKMQRPTSHSSIGTNDYVLKVYTGNRTEYNVSWDGQNNCLNFNPDGSITFCLTNTQTNGRDMINGGAWTMAYDESQGAFTLKNVALGKYLATSGASTTPAYWYLKPAFLSYDPKAVEIVYQTIKDEPMAAEAKEGMESTRTAYKASATADNLLAYGDAVVAAQQAAKEWATAIHAVTTPDTNATSTIRTGIYNLQGQRVNTPTRGIYIVNGKKVMIK